VNTSDATLSWVADDPTIISTSCTLNGVDDPSCASPESLTGLADGDYTFVVTVANGSSHTSADSTSWTVDTTAPQLSLGALPDPGAVVNHGSESPAVTQDDLNKGPVTAR